MARKNVRTKEETDSLCKRLGVAAAVVFIASLSIMNFASISMNGSLFVVSFSIALVGAILAGWAIKVRTGRLALGVFAASFFYIIAAMLFVLSVVLMS